MPRRFAPDRLLGRRHRPTGEGSGPQKDDADSTALPIDSDTADSLPDDIAHEDHAAAGPGRDATDDGSAEPPEADPDNSADAADDDLVGDSRNVSLRPALLAGFAIFVVLAGMSGWFGYRAYQAREEAQQQAQFLDAARLGAVNLSTIDYNEVEAQVQRMLSGSTGTFLNDFRSRAPGFIDFVKKVKSQTQGSVRESGVETIDGNEAKVLVAMAVKVGADGAPADERRWRMRVTVQKTDDGSVKVSNVEFVP